MRRANCRGPGAVSVDEALKGAHEKSNTDDNFNDIRSGAKNAIPAEFALVEYPHIRFQLESIGTNCVKILSHPQLPIVGSIHFCRQNANFVCRRRLTCKDSGGINRLNSSHNHQLSVNNSIDDFT